MPWVGPSTRVAVRVLPSASVSLVNTLPVRVLSSPMEYESLFAMGASLIGSTVIDTAATELVLVPSLTV